MPPKKIAPVCSPAGAEDRAHEGTCFSLAALQVRARRWNDAHADDRIPDVARLSARALWTALRAKVRADCGARSEACWVDRSGPLADSALAGRFAPPKPAEWSKNPRTWLSTTDIDRVMSQYAAVPANRFRWLGAMPRDFREQHPMGGCVEDRMCTLDIAKERERGVTNLGAVFNLDRHDQGGSHWVAAFVCMDPAASVHGVNFSNSVGEPPVAEIRKWCEDIAAVLRCPFEINRVVKQRKNTECGVFSMYILIRCLQAFRGLDASGRRLPAGARPPTFAELCAEHYDDDAMVAMRDRLYRDAQAGGAAEKNLGRKGRE